MMISFKNFSTSKFQQLTTVFIIVILRTREVLQRAHNRSILMEIDEANKIATEEVLEQIAKEEGQRCDEEMRNEEEEINEEKVLNIRKDQARKHEQQQLQQLHAKVKLYEFYLIWKAKSTLRTLCHARYRKGFHPDYHKFYYIDIQTVRNIIDTTFYLEITLIFFYEYMHRKLQPGTNPTA